MRGKESPLLLLFLSLMKGVVKEQLSIFPHQHTTAISTSKQALSSTIQHTACKWTVCTAESLRSSRWQRQTKIWKLRQILGERVVQLARKSVWQLGNKKSEEGEEYMVEEKVVLPGQEEVNMGKAWGSWCLLRYLWINSFWLSKMLKPAARVVSNTYCTPAGKTRRDENRDSGTGRASGGECRAPMIDTDE